MALVRGCRPRTRPDYEMSEIRKNEQDRSYISGSFTLLAYFVV